MRCSNLLGLACVTAGLLGLAGCAGKIRYPNYYTLNVPAPAPVSAKAKPVLGSVAVRQFAASPFLRSGPIVYRQSAEQLNFYNYHRWAEDPRSAVTSAIIQNMQNRGLFQAVQLFDGRGTPDYLVTGKLDHLEEVDKGHDVFVEVGLSAQLMNLKTGDILWRDSSSETSKVEQRTVPSIVTEMSQAVESAVEHLVSSMQDRVLSTSTSIGQGGAAQQLADRIQANLSVHRGSMPCSSGVNLIRSDRVRVMFSTKSSFEVWPELLLVARNVNTELDPKL
jgi:ABC-type uncharacterized transport system auxiliary subunit